MDKLPNEQAKAIRAPAEKMRGMRLSRTSSMFALQPIAIYTKGHWSNYARKAMIERVPHLFNVQEYLDSNVPGHTELIAGIIYDVSPKLTPHNRSIVMLADRLRRRLDPNTYRVLEEKPIAVAGWTGLYQPEIDVAVVRCVVPYELPTQHDTIAAVEASGKRGYSDDVRMMKLYNAAGIPAWLISLEERNVTEYVDGEACRTYIEIESFVILGIDIPVSVLF